MKTHYLHVAITSLFLLSACDVTTADTNGSQAGKATADRAKSTSENQAIADLSKMEIPEIIDFVDGEAKNMTTLLKSVTDGPTAESAVADIRTTIPRLNAALRSLENMDPDNMKLSIGTMRKMLKVAQSQSELFTEVQRISQIPEARAVLEKEFDKIEITSK